MEARARLLALALLSCVPAPGSSRRDVLELSDADFDYLSAEHETLLVTFYAPCSTFMHITGSVMLLTFIIIIFLFIFFLLLLLRCGHCKKLAPDFEKAATRLKGTVQLAKVDCTANLEVCGRFGVSGYPTLKIFRNGRDSGPYDGPRSTEDELQTFIKHYDASVVGADSSHLAEFLRAAGMLREQFRFAHSVDLELGGKSVLLFRPPRMDNKFEDSVIVFREYLTIGSLRRFIGDNIHGVCPHLTMENRDRLRVRDLLTAHYDLDYHHNPRGSNYWRNRVMKMASTFSGRGLFFSVANKKDFLSELEEDFGLGTSDGGELPFVTIRTKLGHKYTMREEFTPSQAKYYTERSSGRLKRFIKSEPIPERNSAAVKTVVAENFDDLVNSPERDVLIQFYSRSCSHCKKLEPLSSNPNIVIARMNAGDNDVPNGYDVQGYPTIYLARAGRKDEPIRYEGGRELRDFLKFLKSESTHRLRVGGAKVEL
ncbi:Protein disulfide-isomerase A3 [Dissostichus eleginoides]|uniref:Protein disulfide-isomerase A3 n=1 Tax=Dissostichus eleginoides TaxID=100907 RepID=A0AAD9ESK3_DISEL|nr:Protein disulfide-isomerase A3 [Dissostichus eleginoides]